MIDLEHVTSPTLLLGPLLPPQLQQSQTLGPEEVARLRAEWRQRVLPRHVPDMFQEPACMTRTALARGSRSVLSDTRFAAAYDDVDDGREPAFAASRAASRMAAPAAPHPVPLPKELEL